MEPSSLALPYNLMYVRDCVYININNKCVSSCYEYMYVFCQYCLIVFVWGWCTLIQVLEQVSPKPDDVLCQTAMLYLDKNRTTNYLPRKCTCIFLMLTKSRCLMCVYFSADEYRVLLKGTPSYIHASFAHVSWHGII